MACHPDCPLWNPHGFSSDTEFWEYGGSSHCLYAPCSEAENQSPGNRHILAAKVLFGREVFSLQPPDGRYNLRSTDNQG